MSWISSLLADCPYGHTVLIFLYLGNYFWLSLYDFRCQCSIEIIVEQQRQNGTIFLLIQAIQCIYAVFYLFPYSTTLYKYNTFRIPPLSSLSYQIHRFTSLVFTHLTLFGMFKVFPTWSIAIAWRRRFMVADSVAGSFEP
jgi:hypothetical protein